MYESAKRTRMGLEMRGFIRRTSDKLGRHIYVAKNGFQAIHSVTPAGMTLLIEVALPDGEIVLRVAHVNDVPVAQSFDSVACSMLATRGKHG